MTRTFGSLSLIAALALAGCAAATNKTASTCCDDSATKTASTDAKTTPQVVPVGRVMVVNTICPIGGDDFDAKDRPAELARTVNGENVGFCCEYCTAKFDKMTDSKKAEVLAAAKSNKPL